MIGKHRHEGDQQHGGEFAGAEPEQEQRRISEAGYRRQHADQRQEDVLRQPRASHQHADGEAEDGRERKAGEQADDGIQRVVRQDAGDRSGRRTNAPFPPASETAGAGIRRSGRRSPRSRRPPRTEKHCARSGAALAAAARRRRRRAGHGYGDGILHGAAGVLPFLCCRAGLAWPQAGFAAPCWRPLAAG